MLTLNWIVIFTAGIIPLLVGAIYYHPKVLGKAAKRAAGLDPDAPDAGHHPKVYVFALLLGVLLAIFMVPIVIHASHIFSIVAQQGGGPAEPNSPAAQDALAFFAKYGGNFRTFGHGIFHGVLTLVFGAWPLLAIHAMFERRSWRYIAVHLGYWAIVLTLLGGVICAFV